MGATGAGVPSPSTTNRTNADDSTTAPATSGTIPSPRKGGHQSPARHPVSHHGTSTATVPGTHARNTELPTAAADLRIPPPWAPYGGP
ncbi:hypothetical protein GCM10023083_86950 [Streptomyces phyllanthi]